MAVDVGRVEALWRYPVKSMAEEALEEVDVSWHGLAGDRRWAFVREGIPSSGFPWLTIRERADMRHFHPRFADPTRPDSARTVIRTPSGEDLGVTDPALAAALGGDVRVIKQDRGIFDVMPLSLISTQTVAGIAAMVGAELEPQRFRPNLLVRAAGDVAFPEDEWVGSVLRIGALRMRVDQRDERCVIVNVDPETDRRNPAILRAIAQQRQACAGIYGSVVEPGRVAVGDAVLLED